MKMLLITLVAAGSGFAAGYFVVASRSQPTAAPMTVVVTNTPKKSLKMEVPMRRKMASSTNAEATVAAPVAGGPDPREILLRLEQTKLRPGPEQLLNIRRVIQLFEDLTDCGPAALTPIREFLARNLECDYEEDTDEIRSGWRDGGMTTDFLLPPSLRLGLLRTVQRLGGEEAERILVDVLNSTGRGVEVAYITRLLEEVAPQKYKAPAIIAAHELLTRPVPTGEVNRLDRRDQEWLYGVLRLYQDASFAQQAQTRLIRDDGSVDSVVLNYLSSTLEGKSVPILAMTYQDNRLTTGTARYQVAYAALRYVGVEPVADQFIQSVLTDPRNSKGMLGDLIPEIPQRGLENRREPTDQDRRILESRQVMLEQFLAGNAAYRQADELKKAIHRITEMRNLPKPKNKEGGQRGS